jgi:hypothetical protein
MMAVERKGIDSVHIGPYSLFSPTYLLTKNLDSIYFLVLLPSLEKKQVI